MSHSILAKNKPMSKQRKSTGKKKGKKLSDRPKRPLSAYNHFFREERKRWLQEVAGHDNSLTSKKRFSKMGQDISQRWMQLNKEERAIYQAMSAESYRVWEVDMALYNARQRCGESLVQTEHTPDTAVPAIVQTRVATQPIVEVSSQIIDYPVLPFRHNTGNLPTMSSLCTSSPVPKLQLPDIPSQPMTNLNALQELLLMQQKRRMLFLHHQQKHLQLQSNSQNLNHLVLANLRMNQHCMM